MSHFLERLSSGHYYEKKKESDDIIETCYTKYFSKLDSQNYNEADFYHAVSQSVGEMNEAFGNTQFQVPTADQLKTSYHRARRDDSDSEEHVSKEEFQNILQKLLITDVKFTGVGAKNTLMYIFGVPLAAFLVKQGLFPRAIRSEIFIPGVTSATVLVLAMLNKI